MRYPNLRYGNPTELQHYAMAYGTTAELARSLRRSERSVKDWLSGAARVPWWVPEVLRLRQMEHANTVQQITGRASLARLGIVQAGIVVDAGHRFKAPEPMPAEPLDPAIFKLRTG